MLLNEESDICVSIEVNTLATCPECGGISKWNPPFYVCSVCGLALRRQEYERMVQQQKEALLEAQYEEGLGEQDKKRKRNREYLDWYLGSKK
ncbi:MAG: hypothetical protein ACFFC6_05995 [Promethearchaeota archaeon]